MGDDHLVASLVYDADADLHTNVDKYEDKCTQRCTEIRRGWGIQKVPSLNDGMGGSHENSWNGDVFILLGTGNPASQGPR